MKKFNGFLDFGHHSNWDPDQAKNLSKQLERLVFDEYESKYGITHKIAVKIEKVNPSQIVTSSEIYIYETYSDALFRINKYETMSDYDVEVFEVIKDTRYENTIIYSYSHILKKNYFETHYSRLAQPTSQRIEIFNLRRWFDNETIFYVETPMNIDSSEQPDNCPYKVGDKVSVCGQLGKIMKIYKDRSFIVGIDIGGLTFLSQFKEENFGVIVDHVKN